MIAVQEISKHYDKVKTVDGISFAADEGENLVLLGPSGCGKTTTLKMINGLIKPSAGCITVNGTDISGLQPELLRRSIGYVLQHNSLFPHYTVAENIAVVPHLLGWDKNKVNARTDELLHKLNLPPAVYLNAYPHQLSGGQQQRVNIARALAAGPPILLMDEPFGALDTITRAAITKEFSELDEFVRKTIVMVTHDVQEAFLLGDRICLMNNGNIEQIGRPLELLFSPASDFVRDFFAGSYLRLALGALKLQDIWGTVTHIPPAAPAAISIGPHESLWAAMEQTIKSKDTATINIQNNEGQSKQVSKEGLFSAILQATNKGVWGFI